MPKINVYLPDDLAEAVKEAGVPVSAVCQRALEQAVRRVTAIRETALADLGTGDLEARLPNATPRTHTVLTLAVERATASGAAEVDSTHLLAGILAEGNNLALHLLRVLEIAPDRVEAALAAIPAGEAGPTIAEHSTRRFSLAAANALELAVTEATGFGHNYLGCEHLLLGLIASPDAVAGQVLRSLGADLRLTRRAVAAALAGYVHLRATTSTGGGSETGVPPAALAAVATLIRAELQPILGRLEHLERQINTAAEK